MKLTKKIVTISTIVFTALTALILIMLLFNIRLFGGVNTNMLITSTTLGIGGFFAINSINLLPKNKILGLVSLCLILFSVVMITLIAWLSFESELYLDITLALGLLSILFNIIVSSGLDLGRSKLVWQILVYLVVGITDIIATLAIFGAIDLSEMIAVFLALIILSVVGVIILKVLAKKAVSDLVEESADMVRITKSEYAELKEKAKKYDEMMSKIEKSKE